MRCMVLVQISSTSAPPASRRCAASTIRVVRPCQSPLCCKSSISRKIERPREAAGGCCRAETISLALIDNAVVFGRTFPAHASDQANRLHALVPPAFVYRLITTYEFREPRHVLLFRSQSGRSGSLAYDSEHPLAGPHYGDGCVIPRYQAEDFSG